MSDGRLNQCKQCKRAYQRKHHKDKSQDAQWLKKERKRTRERYHRLDYGDKYAWENLSEKQKQRKLRAQKKWRRQNKEKVAAHNFVNKHMDIPNGVHAHHWSYREEHRGSVILIHGDGHHNQVHRSMQYDDEAMFYRTNDGRLLDTLQKHLDFAQNLLRVQLDTTTKSLT